MPISIGSKVESGFDDPLGLLSDCHRRIEHFMGVLDTLAQRTEGHMLTCQERDAVTVILRYFREAAPKHTRDEEESLFPRLRARGGPGVRSVLRRVEELEREHESASVWHRELDQLGERWLAEGTLKTFDSERLQDLVELLQRLYREHIAMEDEQVFPAAREVLCEEDLRAIGREMAQRRGLSYDGQPAKAR